MEDEFNPEDIIRPSDAFKLPTKVEPRVDELVSKITGVKVFHNDPRVMKVVIAYKKGKPQDSMEFDNFLEDPQFIADLKLAVRKGL